MATGRLQSRSFVLHSLAPTLVHSLDTQLALPVDAIPLAPSCNLNSMTGATGLNYSTVACRIQNAGNKIAARVAGLWGGGGVAMVVAEWFGELEWIVGHHRFETGRTTIIFPAISV